MNKPKVLIIGLATKAGGIESYVINYCSRINNVNFEFINVFPSCHNEKFYFELQKIGKVHDLPDYRKKPIEFTKALEKLQQKNNYDIFYYNMNSAAYIIPLIAAKKCGIKHIISHSHNSASDKGIIKSIVHNINKHFIPFFANEYFACSIKAGEWFYSKKIINSESFKVINNAVDITKFKYNNKSRNRIRDELKINKDTCVIGHVGRFKVQKNHKYLLEIFETYKRINSNSKLLLIGFGPLEEEIKKIVTAKGLQKDVLFLGEKNNVNEYMSAFDFFILPSLYEGLPVVGVEAQASGLKCIFSNTITEEVKLLDTTEYVPINKDPVLWSEKIEKLRKIKSNREDAYNILCKSDFSIDVATNELEKKLLSISKNNL